ncbi:VOC family protein [Dyella tabacisoli]|uniref:Glyoxalase n=1 Tax=Dyella tabacisoli TaxID=2282381 RepID=A0A369UQ74_9GAMM|nr:VOC family protein [Dyella tabacisoli]RDD81770.1 glyoxalase [Dyella tabacisoli]
MPTENSFLHGPDNQSMPAATVIPVLHYPDVIAASKWLCRTFGFTERLRIGSHRIQLNVGHAAIVVAESPDAFLHPGTVSHSVMVRVASVDQHCKKARSMGAKIISEPTSFPYGERQYNVADMANHVWTFSQTESNVDPSAWGGQWVSSNEKPA